MHNHNNTNKFIALPGVDSACNQPDCEDPTC